VGGAGIVAIGVGAFFGVKAISKNNDAKDICPDNVCASDDGITFTEDAKSAATVANILVIGGAAVAAAGVVLYLTAPSGQERTVGVVSDGRGGARLTFGGSF
jgi:serine/threonine-protein kinase